MRARKLLWAASGATALVVLGLVAFREIERDVPAGQPPLQSLETGGLTAVRAAFNAHTDRTRILAILSPT